MVSPKAFLSSLSDDDEHELIQSLFFVAATNFLLVLMSLPFYAPELKKSELLICMAVLNFLGIVVFSGAIHLGWRVVGCKATFLRCWLLCNYISSAATIMFQLIFLFADSIMIVDDPDNIISKTGIDFIKHGKFTPVAISATQAKLELAFLIVMGIDILIIFWWFLISWGALRNAYHGSRYQSFLAFCVSSILGVPVILAAFLVTYALAAWVLRGGLS